MPGPPLKLDKRSSRYLAIDARTGLAVVKIRFLTLPGANDDSLVAISFDHNDSIFELAWQVDLDECLGLVHDYYVARRRPSLVSSHCGLPSRHKLN